MVTLQIPTSLRAFTDNKSAVSLEGKTAGEVLSAFTDNYPDIKRHLYGDDGTPRAFVNLYLGKANIKSLNGLDTPVSDGDIIMLVPAIAGGSL